MLLIAPHLVISVARQLVLPYVLHTVSVDTNYAFFSDTPRRLNLLHTFSWMCNVFGVFLILAAHEHYSIDVFIAFFITSRMFLYYHSLANSRALLQPDRRRTQAWFPLFSYFESRCDGIVPNEYEWPLPWPQSFIDYFHDKTD